MPTRSGWLIGRLLAFTLPVIIPPVAAARPAESRHARFDIPPGPIEAALVGFGVQAQVTIGTSSRIPDRLSAGLSGRYTLADGLTRLLAGTGLGFQFVNASTIRIIVAPDSMPQGQPAEAATLAAPLPELVVTATKRAVNRDEAAFSIGALSGTEISRAAADNTRDAAMAVAGVTVTNLGPGRNKIFIRGLSDGALTGRMQSTVSVFIDDARATYSAPDPDLRLTDVARLEILRGPQGMLYGAGTLGGIYRIVPNDADASRWEGSINAGASITRHGAPGYGTEGMLNIPVLRDGLALRLVGYREVEGGYIDDLTLGRNVNRTGISGGRAVLKATPGDWIVELGGTLQQIGSRDTHYTTSSDGSLTRSNRVHEPHENDFSQIRLKVEGPVAGMTLSSTTAYVSQRIKTTYDASDALPALAGIAPAPALFDERERIGLLTHETRLVSAQDRPFRWLIGASLLSNADHYDGRLKTVRSSGALYRQESRDDIVEGALFGEIEYQLAARWTANIGARTLWYWQDSDANGSSVLNPPRTSDRSIDGSRITPLAGLRFRPREGAVFYVQIANGYRVGGINASGTGVPAPAESLRTGRFAPDKLWNAELGGRVSLRDGRIKLSGAVFGFIWSGIQTDKLLASGLSYTANAGDAYNYGFEAEAAVQATDRLSIRLGGLLNHPELRPFAAFRHFGGDLPGVSSGSGFIAIHHATPIDSRWTLLADSTLTYVGKSRLSLTADRNPSMGGYCTANLQLLLSSRRWEAGMAVENLLDSRANSFAFGNPFSFMETDQRTPLKPRTISIHVGYRFSD